MLRGLGRSPFGPRTPFAGGPGVSPDGAPVPAVETPGQNQPMPSSPPAAPPPPPRKAESTKETDPAVEAYETLKRHIHMRLVDRLDMNRIAEIDPKTLRNEIRGVVEQLCDTENPLLNRNERQRLVNEILDETFGFGPLELLLKDDKIGDIMINGPKNVLRREGGQDPEVGSRSSATTTTCFRSSTASSRESDAGSMRPRRWSMPGLPDGSRFNAIIPPLALDGPVVTIRMFGSKPLSKDDLLRYKAFTPEMLALMEGAMKARLNIIISGGTGSGKTTLLEHALELHPARSPRDHDRRRRRASVAAGPRGAPGDPARQHRGPRGRHGDRPGQERPPNAARPDHHRRVPRSRDARHDPGHEHRP